MTDLEKLLQYTDQTGDCWLWKGSCDKNGYGVFRLNGATVRVARAAYKIYHSVVLHETQHVLHRCDHPNCLNPDHLFLGSHADNMADMAAKGRANKPTGSKNGRAKLTEDLAREIRQRAKNEALGAGALSTIYGVPRGTLMNLLSGRTWSHL